MELLFTDNQIVVCIKPVGLDSEHELPDALMQQLGGEIYPIHRLDKNVGGVMVYARTKQAAAALPLLTGKRHWAECCCNAFIGASDRTKTARNIRKRF